MAEQRQGQELRLAKAMDAAERVVYFGAALFLLATIGMVFYSAGASVIRIAEVGPLGTALEVLDKVLLVFIFAELLARSAR